MSKPYRLAIIADPIESFKTYKDSTYVMIVEAFRQGAEVFVCLQSDIALLEQTVVGRFTALTLKPHQRTDDHPDWYALGEQQTIGLNDFNAVLMRKDPPFDMEYIYSTYLLEQAQRQGAKVFNDARAIRDHSEKLTIAQFSQFTAPTIVTRHSDDLRAFVREHGQAVFKLLDGMGGASIFQARSDDPNLSVIIETLNQFGARSVMAQRYLPEILQGDKRILLIGGKVVPHALARIPKLGEARGNLAAGGRAQVQALSARDIEIAETLAPELNRRGLFLVGLDVIGNCLTEVNVTSPTGFQEITQQAGFDVAQMFISELMAVT
jgi:glutathione synthase